MNSPQVERNLSSRNWIHFKIEFELERSKLLLIGVVMLFFAVTSVIAIVLLPDLLKLSGVEIIGFPEASTVFVLSDFWNDSLLYFIIIILYAMGTFSSEIDGNKPIYFKLSRPISRRSYYLTRTLIRILGIVFVFTLAGIVAYLLASVYYEQIALEKVIIASIINSLAVGSLISIVIMSSASFKTTTSAFIGIGFVFYQIIVSIFEQAFDWIKWFNPQSLSSTWMDVIKDTIEISDIISSILALSMWIIIPIIIGLIIYEKRSI